MNWPIFYGTLLNYIPYDVSHNVIVGESIQEGLLPYLGKLQCLDLSWNMLSANGVNGYQALATLLEDPARHLEELYLKGSGLRDGVLPSFAAALTTNRTLRTLDLGDNSINAAGWTLFSDVLCDTSSINNTYNSNHTLRQLVTAEEGTINGETTFHLRDTLPEIIEQYLILNQNDDRKKVAAMKIMQYQRHNISMLPFFEWELKCLPIAVHWFDEAPRSIQEIETIKLQAIYEFVRGMPVESADGYFGRKNKEGRREKEVSK